MSWQLLDLCKSFEDLAARIFVIQSGGIPYRLEGLKLFIPSSQYDNALQLIYGRG